MSHASEMLGIAAYTWPNGRVVIRLVGSLDGSSASRLVDEAGRLDVRAGHHLVLHLEDVTFVDSLGISAVLATEAMARDRGCEFQISSPSLQARAILEIAGLDRLLPRIEDDLVGADLAPDSRPAAD
jgi:anti-anti-sigma factor